jgi:deoxyribonuclease-4
VHDAGYDIVNDFDGVLDEFDRIIGKDRIKVLHINDSKNEQGAHKDRHENIGFGHIGFDALSYIINHSDFGDIPKILETPFVGPDKKNRIAPYGHEIEMIRNGKFNPSLKEEINPMMEGIEE